MPEQKAAEPPVLSSGEPGKQYKFPCHKCGADLLFAPGQESLNCPFCGHNEKIPQTAQEIREFSFNDFLATPRSHGFGAGKGQDMRCTKCAALTRVDASVRATVCPFCGAPLIADDGAEGESDVITPEAVVPFTISYEQAKKYVRDWISTRWFAPSELKSESHLKQMQGIYRPFWTYDSHTVSHWSGQRGDYYYVTESYTAEENGKTVTKTRQVRHTRWSYVSGIYAHFFDDVLINAGHNSDYQTTYKLEELKPYRPEFLSGFSAERYMLSLKEGWEKAKAIIKSAIHSGVRSQIGGDEQQVDSVDTAYNGITYKHILLPLWSSCYKYGDKTYCVQVNGQTGVVSGNRPYSVWKIVLLILVILAAIGVVALISNASGN